MTTERLPPDLAAAIARSAEALGPFARLRHVTETESTNDIALALAASGEPEGTAVIADVQRQGRGRRGREWFSPPEAGIYLSVVVRPRGEPTGWALLTLGIGVAAARAIRAQSGLPVELKWPNDLVIGRPWRKLGGVLCETSGARGGIEAVVVGLGVNLRRAAYPSELAERATSIETELGRPIDRALLVAALLVEIRAIVERLHAGEREHVRVAWRAFASGGLAGAPVSWQDQGRERQGRAEDIDVDGALLVRSDGRVERVIAGDVLWDR
jgi:BirA family biotin operon repressor/biotin-[acetyl-CoA-carboxylase] ligase